MLSAARRATLTLTLLLGACGLRDPAPPGAEPGPESSAAPGAAQPGMAPPAQPDASVPEPAVVPPQPAPLAAELRVFVLSGGGWHDFAQNLARLLPAVAARVPLTYTEFALGPSDLARPTSVRMLAAADLPAECDVLLVYTQGDLALPEGLFERLVGFVRGGGGLVALHSALDTFPHEPQASTWSALLGGRFESHPPYGDVLVELALPGHPVLEGLPSPWPLRDEFYHLRDVEEERVELLAGVSPAGGPRRPVAWLREEGDGRVAATILGHGRESHESPEFQRLVAQMLVWAAGD